MSTPPLTNEAIASAVSAAITEAGLSPEAVAQAAEIPAATLSDRLAGTSPLLVTELHAIAEALGLTGSNLLARAERAPSGL